MQYDVLDAKAVLLSLVGDGELTELLSESQAAADVLRRDKVLRNLDRRAYVEDLVRAAGWDEDGLALALHEAVARDALLDIETAPQLGVHIQVRVMYGMAHHLLDALLAQLERGRARRLSFNSHAEYCIVLVDDYLIA